MAMIDLLIDFFFFPSSSLLCDAAEVREAEEPFRRKLNPWNERNEHQGSIMDLLEGGGGQTTELP